MKENERCDNLGNAHRVRSACMGLEGWDIPAAAYVASLCLLRETTLPK